MDNLCAPLFFTPNEIARLLPTIIPMPIAFRKYEKYALALLNLGEECLQNLYYLHMLRQRIHTQSLFLSGLHHA